MGDTTTLPRPDRAPTFAPGPRRALPVWAAVALTVALAAVWPAAWALHFGGPSALVGVNESGPTAPLVEREIPSGVGFARTGHDGQQFYAIARHPFDPAAAAPYLDSPAYRERRILFPVLGWAMAPHGGIRLVWAFLLLSLAGVGLGAWALTRLPGAPWWLPLTLAAVPGVGVALMLSLADALAVGLTLAAFAVARTRRWPLMVALLVAATLTRETSVLAAVALAVTPGLPRRWRVATVAAPALALGTWMWWVDRALGGMAATQAAAQQFALPLVGWLRSPDSPRGLLIGLLSMVVVALGARRLLPADLGELSTLQSLRRISEPAIVVFLLLVLGLSLVLADDVTGSWVNTSRVIAPALPLAVWAIVRRGAADESGDAGGHGDEPAGTRA